MAASNIERIGKALTILRDGLAPYVEREMKSVYQDKWVEIVTQGLKFDDDLKIKKGSIQWTDVHLVLIVLWNNWNNVFSKTLGHAERSIVSELREVRNQWAHQQPFSTDDGYRALDSMTRLLTAISAPEAPELERMKQELLRVRFQEQARRESRRAAVKPTEGQPAGGLKVWRQIVTPHPDVASGRYQQAEFAADLAQVHRGEGAGEYRDPREFFQRTFLTEGLRMLLQDALLRLTGQGGNPVVELQTNFGGGKTHSMLALYHLFSGIEPAALSGIEGLLRETETEKVPKVNRAVLVGTALSPAHSHRKKDGVTVHTLWGEMAWQLGGKKGYAMLAEADQAGVSPGSDILAHLFKELSPCLVLIDEWVAYVRQLYSKEGLPAGSFDANMTFAQSLSEAAKRVPSALVVATLPASEIEIGGEGGHEALVRLRNTFGRVQSPWRPASAEESFEIVRRRVFQPVTEPHHFAGRDGVIDAFSRMYRDQSQEFPSEAKEGDYRRRMESAYPIHPEVFRRLYEDWSTLEKFQRTRGVLRLMATVIHELWERNDSSLLILPGMIPIDAPRVQSELTRYLDDNWVPAIESDIDGPNSLPLRLDRENPNFGRYSACRRVARTIYMGSAPTAKASHPGLDDRSIKLGCVQPGESVATFGDALRHLTDRATYLYVDGRRYWFSTQPSVLSLAKDRAAQQEEEEVWEELKRRLRADRARGDFGAVHVAPDGTADIPDEWEARLVVLAPEKPHTRQEETSQARRECEEILNHRGNSPRLFRNTLIFLAPDRTRLNDLEQSIRFYRAWDSIVRDEESLNLTAFERNQAKTKCDQADQTIEQRIRETYVWLLVPAQPNPQGEIQWQEVRVQGQDPLAVRSARKLQSEEQLITQFSATRLRLELDRYLWKDSEHLNTKKLWEFFCTYVYLARLRDQQVLLEAIQEGIGKMTWMEHFAYAEGWDDENKRYAGLKAGKLSSVVIDSQSLLVKPEAAARQIEQEEPQELKSPEAPPGPEDDATKVSDEEPPQDEVEAKAKRFYASIELDPMRLNRDADQIAQEVLQHLASQPDAKIRVSLEIEARLPEGAPAPLIRTVTENCRTLKFETHGFDED